MSIEVVPEHKVRICNRCGGRDDTTPNPFEHERGKVKLKAKGTSPDGEDADTDETYQLCGFCTEMVRDWLNGDTPTMPNLRRAFFAEKSNLDQFIEWITARGGETTDPVPDENTGQPGNPVMGWHLIYIIPPGTHVKIKKFGGHPA